MWLRCDRKRFLLEQALLRGLHRTEQPPDPVLGQQPEPVPDDVSAYREHAVHVDVLSSPSVARTWHLPRSRRTTAQRGDSSEAYLGNNGFYTGIPGNPALYQTGGGITTAYFTNIQVLDAAGQPATGWTLVTGDAESTDSGEWMVFQSSLNWSILPNSGSISNLWGNACYDTNYSRE